MHPLVGACETAQAQVNNTIVQLPDFLPVASTSTDSIPVAAARQVVTVSQQLLILQDESHSCCGDDSSVSSSVNCENQLESFRCRFCPVSFKAKEQLGGHMSR